MRIPEKLKCNFGIVGIINTGIAGGLHKDVKVCDVVISSDVTHHDVRKKQMKNWFPHQEYFEGDRKLIEATEKALKNSEIINSSCHFWKNCKRGMFCR